MKDSLFAPTPARCVLVSVFLPLQHPVVLPELRADDVRPTIAKPDTKTMSLPRTALRSSMTNGIVTARINKRNGDLESLVYKGLETMGHEQGRAGYWEKDPSPASKVGGLTQSITIDPMKNRGRSAAKSPSKASPRAIQWRTDSRFTGRSPFRNRELRHGNTLFAWPRR